MGKKFFLKRAVLCNLCILPVWKGGGHLPFISSLVIRISTELPTTHGLLSDSHLKPNELMNKSKNKWLHEAVYTLRVGQGEKWMSVSQGQKWVA